MRLRLRYADFETATTTGVPIDSIAHIWVDDWWIRGRPHGQDLRNRLPQPQYRTLDANGEVGARGAHGG